MNEILRRTGALVSTLVYFYAFNIHNKAITISTTIDALDGQHISISFNKLQVARATSAASNRTNQPNCCRNVCGHTKVEHTSDKCLLCAILRIK